MSGQQRELGYTIKVETNGSGGDKNVLTPEEIASCDCIIVAADKDVRMARFDGKPVIVTKVANGIHRAKELIEEAESGNQFLCITATGKKKWKHLVERKSHSEERFIRT